MITKNQRILQTKIRRHSQSVFDERYAIGSRQNCLCNRKWRKNLVYGDYDVDGTTAVSLMYLYLSKIVEKKYLDFYIPDRYSEGYGISDEGN